MSASNPLAVHPLALGLLAALALTTGATASAQGGADRLELPGSEGVVLSWETPGLDTAPTRHYTVSLDGRSFGRTREVSPKIRLRYSSFDPLVAEPAITPALRAAANAELRIVQFVTRPLEAYLTALRELGAKPCAFLADQGWIVTMSSEVADVVSTLPFVRWVGSMHPAYKLEEAILADALQARWIAPRRYSILLFERGIGAQQRVAAAISRQGGLVHGSAPRGMRLEATLTLSQVLETARMPEVLFIDRKGAMEPDMDLALLIGGASFVHNTLGFTGQGVRGEMMDTELELTHPEWKHTPLVHLPGGDIIHGTRVFGAMFSQGLNAKSRGLLPDGQGFFAYRTPLLGGGPTRYQHTAELVDPAGPYRAVFQTASTGDPRSTQYTTISAEMDDILFLYDLLATQSQSNAGNQDSRPQAWAKNIVAVGGIKHWNTLDRADDAWDGYASTGPAADGRVKPDLSHFCENVYTTTVGGGYISGGSGTSMATPIVAGHAGLVFQMWHEGVFSGFGGGATVFDDRPHMTTAKALLVNSAYRYDWNQGGPNADIDRFKQGWGMPDLQRLYDDRERMLIVDETDLLRPFAVRQYPFDVVEDDVELRVTLVYADPRGNPVSTVHRINDLSLRVTDPLGMTYWGNAGLTSGNVSVSGGTANTIDTTENVFLPAPQPGTWLVEVIADEINEDSHTETPQLDADFALVVAVEAAPPVPPTLDVLWDNGPLVSHPGQAAGGADASVRESVSLGESYMGYSHHVTDGSRVADDFELLEPCVVQEVDFWAYQIGAGAGNPTITAVNVRLWDGPPGDGSSQVVLGDTTTNRMTSTVWDNLYRVDETAIAGSTSRAVYRNTCKVGTWRLPPGRYWIDWQTDGSLSSGPWVLPISIPGQTHPAGANARQFSNGSWHAVQDAGSLTPDDFRFVLRGRLDHVSEIAAPSEK